MCLTLYLSCVGRDSESRSSKANVNESKKRDDTSNVLEFPFTPGTSASGSEPGNPLDQCLQKLSLSTSYNGTLSLAEEERVC